MEISLSDLVPWKVGDWQPGTDYDPDTFKPQKKQYFYNSNLALQSSIFASPTPPGAPKQYSSPS